MERIKKKGVIICILSAIGVAGAIVGACQSDEDSSSLSARVFDNEFSTAMSEFVKSPIVVSGTQKSRGNLNLRGDSLPLGVVPVYVDFGSVEGDGFEMDEVLTPDDMIDLAINFGAEYSLEDDGMRDDTIFVSEQAAADALLPVLECSRRLLNARGLSNADIDAALAETNANECVLIPFAMLVALSVEMDEQELLGCNFGLGSAFAFRANAQSSWTKSRDCLFKAFGVNDAVAIFNRLRDSAAGGLTVMIAVNTITKLAPRMLGYVGAAIVLVEFADCMYYYHRYF